MNDLDPTIAAHLDAAESKLEDASKLIRHTAFRMVGTRHNCELADGLIQDAVREIWKARTGA